ncbi:MULTISPECIES: CcdB family protein [Cellvibrio]|jgi:toxin CcdB|uniref:Toxin CcdB n=1 Tax=Cellvibrio fibrivorans TaxID=126350 RepID=A0ABU1UWI1_9GAMM|nr:CcdB family protein [Cellvibrio fibrivorans]MDR7089510.1 toxin CcdB [Cellvibrio fibrivorans]
MSQFRAYKNHNLENHHVPYLLDVQNDLLAGLDTRMVIPLIRESSFKGSGITTLTPKLTINGETLLLLTPQMAGISKHLLTEEVGNLGNFRYEILAAINLLIEGF